MSGALPATWKWATLDQLLSAVEAGSRPKGGVRSIQEGVASIGGEHLGDDGGIRTNNTRYVPVTFAERLRNGWVKRGDILIVKDGATTGKVAFVDESFPHPRALLNEHVLRLEAAPGVDPKYLYYWLRSEGGQTGVRSDFRGAAQGGISKGFASKVPVPVAPTQEQRRIAAKLDELLANSRSARAAVDTVPTLLEKYRQSVVVAAFNGDLTSSWRLSRHAPAPSANDLLSHVAARRQQEWQYSQTRGAYSNAGQVDQRGQFTLPERWSWATLEQVTSAVFSPCYGVVQPGPEVTEGVPLVRVCDIDGGQVRLEQLRTIASEVDAEYGRSRLRGGEVLVTVVGTIGRVAVAPPSLAGANIARAVVRLVPVPPIPAEWLALALSTPWAQDTLTRESREVARKTLNVGSLTQVMIPVAPVEEMNEIIRRVKLLLAAADKQAETVDVASTNLTTLESVMLAKAFRGELVPQAPADEPATALLARVRREGPDDRRHPAARRPRART